MLPALDRMKEYQKYYPRYNAGAVLNDIRQKQRKQRQERFRGYNSVKIKYSTFNDKKAQSRKSLLLLSTVAHK